MAWQFGDSFDHYATADLLSLAKWTQKGSGLQTIGAGGRNGTQGLAIVGNTSGSSPYVFKGLPASFSTACILGAGVYPQHAQPTAQGAFEIFAVYEGAIKHVALRLSATGALQVFHGDTTTQIGSDAPGFLSQLTYYYVEFKTVIHDTAGTAVVRVNGVEVLNLSSRDTRNGGTGVWNGFRLGDLNCSGTGTRPFCTYDDLYCCDGGGADNNDFIGPIRFKAALVDSAGTYAQFTPSTGANYQNVDDALQNGDTDYNSTITVGQLDTYGLAALGLGGIVKAVQLNLIVRSNSGGGELIAPVVRIGGVDYIGASIAGMSTAYQDKVAIYERSPATSAPWTVSEIDGAEFGLKLVG